MTLPHQNLAPGYRKLGPNAFAGMARHETYKGLPDHIATHTDLLTMFKRAAPELGIREHLVSLFERLVLLSQPQDWEAGRAPVVWPSNTYLADILGLGERQVANRLKALIDANLIVAKDSPSGRRYGRRDADGNIIEAYGFALGLLAVRYDEFRGIAERAAAERAAKQAYRRQITIARRGIRQLAQTGQEHQVPGYDWIALAGLAEGEKPSLIDDLDRLEQEAAKLTAIREKAEKHFNNTVEIASSPATDCSPITNTTDIKNDSGTKGQARTCRRRGMSSSDVGTSVTPGQIVAAAPKLKDHLRPRAAYGGAAWDDVVGAARSLLHPMGINRRAWNYASDVMGDIHAAIAVAITSARLGFCEIESPGGYFLGIARKFEKGEANLEGSVWGILKRC